ncbi:hypothetical protein VNO78_11895 [Psophocarpus tetragonolobus]|uniref:Uncharacterized protein n=1 Tax=Psophocarpus tetragonolobus TaxID=3891 RepID=A0AAN9SQ23_PSOTE
MRVGCESRSKFDFCDQSYQPFKELVNNEQGRGREGVRGESEGGDIEAGVDPEGWEEVAIKLVVVMMDARRLSPHSFSPISYWTSMQRKCGRCLSVMGT